MTLHVGRSFGEVTLFRVWKVVVVLGDYYVDSF